MGQVLQRKFCIKGNFASKSIIPNDWVLFDEEASVMLGACMVLCELLVHSENL